MDFTEDELAEAKRAHAKGILEYARRGQALDMHKRFGKPLPEAQADDSFDEGLAEDEEMPGVEAAPEEGEKGEGDDEQRLNPERLRALLERLKSAPVE